MSLYNHFSLEEREKLLKFRLRGKGLREVGRLLNRSPSSISREFNRNGLSYEDYSAIKAQRQYENRRRKSRRKK